jgi:hypothetical protein
MSEPNDARRADCGFVPKPNDARRADCDAKPSGFLIRPRLLSFRSPLRMEIKSCIHAPSFIQASKNRRDYLSLWSCSCSVSTPEQSTRLLAPPPPPPPARGGGRGFGCGCVFTRRVARCRVGSRVSDGGADSVARHTPSRLPSGDSTAVTSAETPARTLARTQPHTHASSTSRVECVGVRVARACVSARGGTGRRIHWSRVDAFTGHGSMAAAAQTQ